MTQRHRWKTALQYVLGMLALAVCIALAIFVPSWYARWQDENLIDKVALENRENIEFIDVHSLDLEGRLKILQEAEYVGIGEVYNTWIYGNNEQEIEEKVQELIQSWYEAGLLPEPPEAQYSKDYHHSMISFYLASIEAGNARIPVYIGRFGLPDFENVLTVVLDQEKEILYYASVSGGYAMDYLAGELGYENMDVLTKECLTGDAWEKLTATAKETGTQKKDYASVCGAVGAEIFRDGEIFEEKIKLEFETFQGYAYRKLISSEYGFGVAVMYGTEQWCDVLRNMSEEYGFDEIRCGITLLYLSLRGEIDFQEEDAIMDNVEMKENKEKAYNYIN